MTLEGDQAVDISYHFLRKKRLVFDVFGRTCYRKTTIVWMVAKSCTTLDGWNPNYEEWDVYHLSTGDNRISLAHPPYVSRKLHGLGGPDLPLGYLHLSAVHAETKRGQRFEGTSFDGFHWGFPPVMPDILAFWGLDLSDILNFLDIDWI